jgi:hypothetical protein
LDQAALGGLAFVLLLGASAVMLGELAGAFGDPDHVFADYYSKASNRWGDIAGGYLLTFAGVAFLVFAGGMEERLRQASGDSSAGRFARSSGTLFAALVIVSAAAWMTVSLSVNFGEGFGDERPFSSGYAMMPQLGAVVIMVIAPIAASAHILAVTLAFRRLVPAFVTVTGYVCAAALLLSVLYIPFVALPVWVLIVSLAGKPVAAQVPDSVS